VRPTVLLDLDDTLIATGEIYWKARHAAAALILAEADGRTGAILDLIDRIDHEAATAHGFGKDRFPASLREAYRRTVAAPCAYTERALLALGYAVYDTPAAILPGTQEALDRLGDTHDIVIVTKGDHEVQQTRLQHLFGAGYGPYFKACHIVDRKDTATFERILRERGLRADETWMVGDSVRSDINPVLPLGIDAVHLTGRSSWSYEQAEAAGHYHAAPTLLEAAAIIQREEAAVRAALAAGVTA
jgi:putative hydrolase of the HAD superfamily